MLHNGKETQPEAQSTARPVCGGRAQTTAAPASAVKRLHQSWDMTHKYSAKALHPHRRRGKHPPCKLRAHGSDAACNLRGSSAFIWLCLHAACVRLQFAGGCVLAVAWLHTMATGPALCVQRTPAAAIYNCRIDGTVINPGSSSPATCSHIVQQSFQVRVAHVRCQLCLCVPCCPLLGRLRD